MVSTSFVHHLRQSHPQSEFQAQPLAFPVAFYFLTGFQSLPCCFGMDGLDGWSLGCFGGLLLTFPFTDVQSRFRGRRAPLSRRKRRPVGFTSSRVQETWSTFWFCTKTVPGRIIICHVLGFDSCLVSSFPVLFWNTNCPSRFRYLALPPVSSVWLSSLISKVFPPVPHGSSCAQIVCVSLVLCQCVATCYVPHSSILVPQYPQSWTHKPEVERSSYSAIFCCKFSIALV